MTDGTKIRSGKITGYVKSEYILTGQQAEDKAMQVAKLMAIANTDGVNVRSEPNTESRIWTQIASSEKFLVVSRRTAGWRSSWMIPLRSSPAIMWM